MYAGFLLFSLALASLATSSPIEQRACTGPNINAATIALIKEFEGFVASPEPDPIGLPTVGYGHLCQTQGCGEVPYSFPLTETTATQLLLSDVKSFQQGVTLTTNSGVTLNENQFGALVSFSFNVGNANFASSTLLRRLNAGEDELTVIEEELPKWNKAGGQVLPGLTRRRNTEIALAQQAGGPALPVGC
ncbi:glycoside hydrolase family 24 protein [Periconia macrospinosa]|uniref:Glycoside hydrolase family 24 protein n=1 Tax=Periconia macrospinosa TaxID=97972 RepID=A0A2V1E0E4_9PLEO|nr:glycoside hydrolase family 24 protein [Periconia macrospinosa]